MNSARSSDYDREAKRLELSVEPPGIGEHQEPIQKGPGEKADIRMENIKAFIRNIDVKSL